MARLPRIVIPGCPHHVTQRGNRKARVFHSDDDYELYRDLLSEAADKAGSEVWAYCLMPNHVHVIIVPADEDGLRRTFAEAHRRYTTFVNTRQRTSGHLWQGRFGSAAMDEGHLFHAVRYVSLNPVRARLVKRAADWAWSSVPAHLARRGDGLVKVKPVLKRYGKFASYLGEDGGEEEGEAFKRLRQAESTGRPVGAEKWLKQLERQTGRRLRPLRRGPKSGTRGEKD